MAKNSFSTAQGPANTRYTGGLFCARDGLRLLDVGQENAEMDKKVLRYHMKWRVWFQEYMPPGGTPGGRGASMVENPPPRQPASHANHLHDNRTRSASHANQSEGNAGEYVVSALGCFDVWTSSHQELLVHLHHDNMSQYMHA